MSRRAAIVCPASPGRLLAAWPALVEIERQGFSLEVASAGDLEEILPASWRARPGGRGRPDVAVLLEQRPAAWWAALRSGARRWRRLAVPEAGRALDPADVPLGDEDRLRARERLERAGLGGDAVLVAIHPFRGRPEPWVELLRGLRRELRDVRPVLLVTPAELWTAVRIHERTARAVPVLGAEGGMRDLAALVAEMGMFVGADDLVAGLARLIGVPVLSWAPPRSRFSGRPVEVDALLARIREVAGAGSLPEGPGDSADDSDTLSARHGH